MFHGFDAKSDRDTRRRLIASTGGSFVVYAAIVIAVVAYAGRAEPIEEKARVDVTFRPPPPPPPPPPVATPPPPTKKPPKAPPPAAPPAAPTVEAVVPKEMPKELPKEGPPVESRTPRGAVLGQGQSNQGTGTVAEAPPPAPPPPPPPKVKEPVNLPENGTPAEPSDDNVSPEPPVEMIEKGIAGKVILKVVISETGKVTKLDVMKGEEPFVSAAVAAVKTWTYKPATVDGAPIAVFKIVKIDFAPK